MSNVNYYRICKYIFQEYIQSTFVYQFYSGVAACILHTYAVSPVTLGHNTCIVTLNCAIDPTQPTLRARPHTIQTTLVYRHMSVYRYISLSLIFKHLMFGNNILIF